jgi:hypothetical protein
LQTIPKAYVKSAEIELRNGLATSAKVKLNDYLRFGMSKFIKGESSESNLVTAHTWERFV